MQRLIFLSLLPLFIFSSLVQASYYPDFYWEQNTEKNTLEFYSDRQVQQLDMGEILVDAGNLTVFEVNDKLTAGSNGFSGADVNDMTGSETFTPGSVVAFSWACTGAEKATGLIASFKYDEVLEVWIFPEENLGSGVDAFVMFDDGSKINLSGTYIPFIPEPMTMSLLGLGGLVAARRRRA